MKSSITKIVLAAVPALAMIGPAAANAGSVDALFETAIRYEHAAGVPRDYAKAMSLYCAAANQGHAGAAYNIGWMYLNARGVPRNEGQGIAWLRRAAELGNDHAPKLLEHLPDRTDIPERSCGPGGRREGLPAVLDPPAAFEEVVHDLAPEYGLDPDLVLAVMAVESGFRPDALSPKNAQGLMQLLPETARRFGVSDPFDPVENIRGGMEYLRWLLQVFHGDVRLALAGYNAGENAVERYGGVPPYPETIDYIKKVRRYYPPSRHPILRSRHSEAASAGGSHPGGPPSG